MTVTVEETLKARAAELGFNLCGIATAEPSQRAEYVRHWIAEGRHAEMAWLAKNIEKRCDPALVLPHVQSIIAVAASYHQPQPPGRARVAQYALGGDYHKFLEPKLKQLAQTVRELAGGETLHYLDTGPVLERELAARAGLGWQGKSTMLIAPKLGTYFFLGEILSTAALRADAPMKEHCGSCTRCITACPTGAITAPFQLDPRRCIAYLTIEHRGPIPLEYREAIGNRLFGCDDCLDACPWNKFAQQTRETALAARNWPDAREICELDDVRFRTLFAASPLLRTKLRGLQRNAAVVLGNIGNENDLPALQKLAQGGDELVAEHAIWAIARIQARCDEGNFSNASGAW